jgi:hypothetical protein
MMGQKPKVPLMIITNERCHTVDQLRQPDKLLADDITWMAGDLASILRRTDPAEPQPGDPSTARSAGGEELGEDGVKDG